MIDNLTEAIAHAKEVAKKNKNLAKTYESFKDYGNPKSSITSGHKRCLECATEHEQLAAWLEELQERREADRWIPVSERTPNTLGVYNVTRKIIEGETNYVISDACYFDGQNTWHADTGVNHDRPYITDVIAWKPKPEPYESED